MKEAKQSDLTKAQMEAVQEYPRLVEHNLRKHGLATFRIPSPLVLDPKHVAQVREYVARSERREHWKWMWGVLVEGLWYFAIVAAGVASAIWIVGHAR